MTPTLHGGEGYGFQPWESMEAAFNADHLTNLLEAKVHGPPPPKGSGLLKNLTNLKQMTHVQKRSFKRAYARALRDGIVCYRGQHLTPDDFPCNMPCPVKSSPSRPAGVPSKAPTNRALHHRLNIVQFNVGGLSTHKLEEIKQWGLHIQADIIVLLESRWSFSSE